MRNPLDLDANLDVALIVDPYDEIEETDESDNTFAGVIEALIQEPAPVAPVEYSADDVQVKIAKLGELLLVNENTISPTGEPYLSEVVELVDAVYFLLYGKALLDEQVFVHTFTDQEYESLVEIVCQDGARSHPVQDQKQEFENCVASLNAALGYQSDRWGHERIIMRGEVTPASLIDTFAHELGHFRQAVDNPDLLSTEESTLNISALKEAQAYAHTMVMLRALEEFLETPLLLYPELDSLILFAESSLQGYVDEVEEVEHSRGWLLL